MARGVVAGGHLQAGQGLDLRHQRLAVGVGGQVAGQQVQPTAGVDPLTQPGQEGPLGGVGPQRLGRDVFAVERAEPPGPAVGGQADRGGGAAVEGVVDALEDGLGRVGMGVVGHAERLVADGGGEVFAAGESGVDQQQPGAGLRSGGGRDGDIRRVGQQVRIGVITPPGQRLLGGPGGIGGVGGIGIGGIGRRGGVGRAVRGVGLEGVCGRQRIVSRLGGIGGLLGGVGGLGGVAGFGAGGVKVRDGSDGGGVEHDPLFHTHEATEGAAGFWHRVHSRY